MKWFAGFALLVSLALLTLPPLPAQDAKGDDKKAEKKDGDKKADDKKADKDGDKKDEKKKGEKKKKTETKAKLDPEEDKILNHSILMKVKIKQMDANSGREFSVEVPMQDPEKMFAVQVWLQQQMLQARGNPLRMMQIKGQYQQKLMTETSKDVTVKAGETMKVRTLNPPVEYDLKGNLKRYSEKDLKALRGSSKLPGFPAEMDAVRAGQYVDLYVAKSSWPTTPTKGVAAAKKKKVDDDDLPPRPEVLMIVIVVEPPR